MPLSLVCSIPALSSGWFATKLSKADLVSEVSPADLAN
jgi:hypothetical protein